MSLHNGQEIMIIDCQLVGISGNMIVAALLDLGANPKRVLSAIRSIKEYVEGCGTIDVDLSETTRCGLRAKQVKIIAHETVKHRSGSELMAAVTNSAIGLNLSSSAQIFAERSVGTLLEAESGLHGESVENVVLHEAGSVDTVVDIIGVAAALDDLGAFRDMKVYSTPVAVGGGLFSFSHGTVASPAPATLEILTKRGFTIVGGPLDCELSTPTGVAILTSLAERSLRYFPAMKPKAVGYGAGEKEFDAVPNILRIVTGEASRLDPLEDRVVLLETNLDDVTGETVGYTVERLLSAGAKDAAVTPIFGKKSRPGWIVSVIAEERDVDKLIDMLTLETGTLGVRVHPCHRKILLRESRKVEVEIAGAKAEVNVKIASDRFGKVTNLKPEYDDVRNLALRLGRPFREIQEEATHQAKKKFGLR